MTATLKSVKPAPAHQPHRPVTQTGRPEADMGPQRRRPSRLRRWGAANTDGRTLHLIDLDNLLGGTVWSKERLNAVAARYQSVAHVTAGDHLIVGVDVHGVVAAAAQYPGARVLAGYGTDGADRELLAAVADLDWIASRYDRVVIASGDGCFAQTAQALVRRGVAVTLVARPHSVANALLTRLRCLADTSRPGRSSLAAGGLCPA